jgi:Arc/MetJ-type ribon-helix-helix transcriptional regulator
MDVRLTPDQEAFIRRAIDTGRINKEQESVREAVLLWEARERRRLESAPSADRAETPVSGNEAQ